MANALPQAIGAQAAFPGRQIVTLSGDGGLTMLLGDLISLRQNALPVKVVVFNNGALSFVELEMKAAGIVNFGTELENPNFADVATALGLHGERVSEPDALDGALARAFAHDGPALVEVLVARQELSLPPTITAEATSWWTWRRRTCCGGCGGSARRPRDSLSPRSGSSQPGRRCCARRAHHVQRKEHEMAKRVDLSRRQLMGVAGGGGLALLLGGVRPGTSGSTPLDAGVDEALAATCTMTPTPAKTVGPYFVDEKLNRSDVRGGQAGIPLELTLYVFDADNDCAPVSGAQVDIWHCNASGLYSDESANGTSGQTWLRGYQTTDSAGKVTFTTNYPGWYSGRAIHIHYKVRVYDGTTETLEFTSQLFFTDAQNRKVLADSRYSSHGTTPDTTDGTDTIYGNDTSLLLQPTGSNSAGYAAQFSVGVSKTTSQLDNTSAGAGGGPGGAGGGPGGTPPTGGPGGTATADTSVAASLASVTSLRRSGHRNLKMTLTSTEAVTAVAKLTRAGKTLATKKASLAIGTHPFSLVIPSAVSAGGAQLTITVKDAAGNTKTIKRTVHVRSRSAG